VETILLCVLQKKIKKDIIPHPVRPKSFLDALESLRKILKTEGHKLLVESDAVTVWVTDWEIRKAIAKADIADCGIVTIQSYQGLMRGLFGREMGVLVEHTKDLNQGDDCCEVFISTQAHPS
jgi:hypothetical protein